MNALIGTLKDTVTLVRVSLDLGYSYAFRASARLPKMVGKTGRYIRPGAGGAFPFEVECISVMQLTSMTHLSAFEHAEPTDKDPSLIVLVKLAASGNYIISESAVKALNTFILTFTAEPGALDLYSAVEQQVDAADL